MKKPILIEIEGTDGVGKNTQSKLLFEALSKKYKVKIISFPTYEEVSEIKKYLNGEYGTVDDVNIYLSSILYSIDRKIAMDKIMKEDYDIIIADRYTASNYIHQASKLPKEDFNLKLAEYIDYFEDLEHEKFKLIRPDIIFYLYLDVEKSKELRIERAKTNGVSLDIHEANEAYMKKCTEVGLKLCGNFKWRKIDCIDSYNGDYLKSKEEIHGEILNIVSKTLCL